MIDELEIAYISFYASYAVIMELDTKKKLRKKIWTWGMVAEAEQKRSL